eukprot:gb/GEZN01001941.1/.p1 GENE.gb/GEZN01001941.1/~~gb/GEZN01001941.1/.p1  ORF type:complete len:909 (+),score=110.38 gb/GEZN01001941.1/:2-2728(+)
MSGAWPVVQLQNLSVQVDVNQISIRRGIGLPGERLEAYVDPGEVLNVVARADTQYTHSDGQQYSVLFYQLQDGRGWIHDFRPDSPGVPGLHTLPRGATSWPVVPQHVRVKYIHATRSCALRKGVGLPGERLAACVNAGGTLSVIARAETKHTHSDGKVYNVMFYQLEDGRGWLHDFNLDQPGVSTVQVLPSESTSSPVPENKSTPWPVVQLQNLSVRNDASNQIAIRRGIGLPGERLEACVVAGEVLNVVARADTQYTHSDGQQYTVLFYQLQDGRGWIHDFRSESPGVPALRTLPRGATSWPVVPQHVRVKYIHGTRGCALRKGVGLPGERLAACVNPGETLSVIARAETKHTHSDGKVYNVMFYQLEDGRGWLHDFNSDQPGVSSIQVVSSESTSRPAQPVPSEPQAPKTPPLNIVFSDGTSCSSDVTSLFGVSKFSSVNMPVVLANPLLANTKLEGKYWGSLVLVERGGVSFVEKARIVQAAGASGMILFNDERDMPDKLGDSVSDVYIGAVCVPREVGLTVRKKLEEGKPVLVTISNPAIAHDDLKAIAAQVTAAEGKAAESKVEGITLSWILDFAEQMDLDGFQHFMFQRERGALATMISVTDIFVQTMQLCGLAPDVAKRCYLEMKYHDPHVLDYEQNWRPKALEMARTNYRVHRPWGNAITTKQLTDAIIYPRTGASYTYSDLFVPPEHKGPGTVFVSHSWGYPFWSLLESLIYYELGYDRKSHMYLTLAQIKAKAAAKENKSYFWIDIFCKAQHVVNSGDTQKELARCVKSTGTFLFVTHPMDNWSLKRVWCLFEVQIALQQEVAILIGLTGRFVDQLETNHMNWQLTLPGQKPRRWNDIHEYVPPGSVDVSRAQATVESDRVMILKWIQESAGGFDAMNKAVLEALEKAFAVAFKAMEY